MTNSFHNKATCAVVGASHAGVNFAFALRREGWEGPIVLYDTDPELPYHRPPLSKTYLTDTQDAAVTVLKSKESYQREQIQLRLGQKVVSIDAEDKQIVLEDGSAHPFTKLVLATGSRPIIPRIPGLDVAKNVFSLRTLADVTDIRNAIGKDPMKKVVIIGGGYIGLEIAASLRKLGSEVTVLEREKRILARVTAFEMSQFFKQLHKQNGVEILTNKNVTSVATSNGLNEVVCDDGSRYPADVIVIGVGILVNTNLAQAVGLTIENGIKVDATARTSHQDIYAIGDCTSHYNPHYDRYLRLESVQNAVDQAKVAAAALCGKEVVYDTIPWFWSDQYDVKLQMVGLCEGYDNLVIRTEDKEEACFSIWYFSGDALLAVHAINNAKAYVVGTKFIKSNQLLDKSKLADSTVEFKPAHLILA